MRQEKLPSLVTRGWRTLARRGFIRNVAGAGTGLMLGSEIEAPASGQQAAHPTCPAVPRPIPHITTPPGGHFFFPGPVDASPITSPDTGHDPSLITDFSGVIGQADLEFSGKGTNLNTGQSSTYDFHCDLRFMNGVYVGLDNERRHGSIGFI